MMDWQALLTVVSILVGIDMTILSFVIRTKSDIHKLEVKILHELRTIEHRLTRLESKVYNGGHE